MVVARRSVPPSWTASQSDGTAGATQRTDHLTSSSPPFPILFARSSPSASLRPSGGADAHRSPPPSTISTSLHLLIPPAGAAPQVLSPTRIRCRQDLSICRPRSALCGPRRSGQDPEDSKEILEFSRPGAGAVQLRSYLCSEALRPTGNLRADRVESAFLLDVHHAEEGGGEGLPPPVLHLPPPRASKR